MATIVTRSGKGSALTHVEMDANFTNLNDDKADTSNVLTKDNTASFTPDSNYEPATKKYVDDKVLPQNETLTDVSNVFLSGLYRVNNTTVDLPVAAWGGFYIAGDGSSSGISSQLYIRGSNGDVYTRGRQSSSWSSWKKLSGTNVTWATFDFSTTSPTISGSNNIASIVKSALGEATVTFATALSNANYSITTTAGDNFGFGNRVLPYINIKSKSTTECVLYIGEFVGSSNTRRIPTNLTLDNINFQIVEV